jgi:prepilin-type N-terminal cleavage/methylation domain-containing protein
MLSLNDSQMKEDTMKRCGFTLRELLVTVILVSMAMAGWMVFQEATTIRCWRYRCGSNLSQLIKSMYNYTITKAPIEGEFPAHQMGGAFWLVLYETMEVDDPKAFVCPHDAATPTDGKHTSYRGPRVDPNPEGPHIPFGCDRPGNHDSVPDLDMNWVAKSGDVHRTPADAVRWKEILRATRE